MRYGPKFHLESGSGVYTGYAKANRHTHTRKCGASIALLGTLGLWTPRTDLVQWGAETGGRDPLVSPDSNLVLDEDTPFGEVQIPQDRWLLPCPAFCQPA